MSMISPIERMTHDLSQLAAPDVIGGKITGSVIRCDFNGLLTDAEMERIERHFGVACRGIIDRRHVYIDGGMRWVKVVADVEWA